MASTNDTIKSAKVLPLTAPVFKTFGFIEHITLSINSSTYYLNYGLSSVYGTFSIYLNFVSSKIGLFFIF